MYADERGEHGAEDKEARDPCQQPERKQCTARKFRQTGRPREEGRHGKTELTGPRDETFGRRYFSASVSHHQRDAGKDPQQRQPRIRCQ
jgi:hypothetical protein